MLVWPAAHLEVRVATEQTSVPANHFQAARGTQQHKGHIAAGTVSKLCAKRQASVNTRNAQSQLATNQLAHVGGVRGGAGPQWGDAQASSALIHLSGGRWWTGTANMRAGLPMKASAVAPPTSAIPASNG